MKTKHMIGGLLVIMGMLFLALPATAAETESIEQQIDRLAREVEPKVMEWRHDIHQNPELSNREFRTSKIVARHLKKLGMEVKTDVARTGVIGILRGNADGPVVALRADMDALPVTEETGAPYASKNKGVMHACGHDSHTAVLMGTAEVLSKMKDKIPGTVKFIFQPAEEGAPEGEEGGAPLMIKEGALENPKVDAIFGLHVVPMPAGTIAYKSGALMAAVDIIKIVVTGKQTHGGQPQSGIDPIVVASQIVMGAQTIVSRQINVVTSPTVISIGQIHGGERWNIIPEKVEMTGTIRTLDKAVRTQVAEKLKRTAQSIADAAGAKAEVTITHLSPVCYNNPALHNQMLPTLKKLVSSMKIFESPASTGGEDFSY
ncbi:MAG TPA: amidohydrolase, partial [Smithellaceae bacterium]|nr:amidohydrolase [Smithellaceae bacterium]